MLVKRCEGFELEKEQSNTSEDFFNRSVIEFIDNGKEKTFHVLYVRFFDQQFSEITPFENDPIFHVNGKDIFFRDIVAFVCLLKNPGLRTRKRIYINEWKEFSNYFQDIQFEQIKEAFAELSVNGVFEVKSPLHFIVQPS